VILTLRSDGVPFWVCVNQSQVRAFILFCFLTSALFKTNRARVMSLHSNQGNTNSDQTEINCSSAKLAQMGNSDITKCWRGCEMLLGDVCTLCGSAILVLGLYH